MKAIRILFYVALIHPLSSIAMNQDCRSDQQVPQTTPTDNFLDNEDGTITDLSNGLSWSKCTVGQSGQSCADGERTIMRWEDALAFASNSNLAEFSDWRVPNVKELATIVEFQCISPAINLEIFPNTPDRNYWTSSPRRGGSFQVWAIDFQFGSTTVGPFERPLRLVRGGGY